MTARRIVGFHQDAEQHWVADLECSHSQHVRHDPPWQVRPWVTTADGRARFIGVELRCVTCTEAQRPERAGVASIRQATSRDVGTVADVLTEASEWVKPRDGTTMSVENE